VNAWQPSIIEGLVTGISNGRTEGLQQDRQTHREDRLRIQERGANQKRRIRFACTRASRRAPTSTPKPC